jgi:hypothetical protein
MCHCAPTLLDDGRVRALLRLLWEAYELASVTKLDRGEFAVEIASLAPQGVTRSQLRWLLSAGFIEARRETTTDSARNRTFQGLASLTLPVDRASC